MAQNYKNDTPTLVTETFINPPQSLSLLVNRRHQEAESPAFLVNPLDLNRSYALPLEQESVHGGRGGLDSRPLIAPATRVKALRLRVLDTVNHSSRFVHLSMFRLNTPLGPLGKSYVTVSNPSGVRKTPKEGPDAAFAETRTKRWVDFNRQPLYIQFEAYPPTPIQSYEFSVPTGVAQPYDAMPRRWVVEGTLDGRTWILYHDQSQEDYMYTQGDTVSFPLTKEI
jgi:hypothetical protein